MAKPPTVSEAIAASVRKYRNLRGWSVRELSEKCAEFGATSLTPASLTNIERGLTAKEGRGSRAVTVDELLVLAAALGVPPVVLMLPFGGHNRLAVSPGRSMDLLTAFRWFVGGPEAKDLLHRGIYFEDEPPLFNSSMRAMRRIAEIENAREAAERIRQMLYGDPQILLSTRRHLDAAWKNAKPAQRARYEDVARENNRPLPGTSISDQEYVDQWREALPAAYERALMTYAGRLWHAFDSEDLQVLPPVPQDLYDDIMKLAAEEPPDVWDVDPVTGLPRDVAAPGRPLLPPDILIEVLDEDRDGER